MDEPTSFFNLFPDPGGRGYAHDWPQGGFGFSWVSHFVLFGDVDEFLDEVVKFGRVDVDTLNRTAWADQY